MAITDIKRALWELLYNEYKTRNVNVKVTLDYPKTVQDIDTIPYISIARISGVEEIMMITDLMGQSQVIGEAYNQTYGYLNQEVFEVSIWATNSEFRDDLLVLTNHVMFEKRLYLASHGMQKIMKVGANDEEIDVGDLPRTIYRGVLRYLIMSKVQFGTTDLLVKQINPMLLISTPTNIG